MEASFTELGGQEVRTAGLAVRTVRRVGPSLLRGVQLAVVALAATVAVALGVLPNLGLYRTLTVLSGSMVKVPGSPSSSGCVTTPNSLHCRTELRETSPSSWDPKAATNRLSVSLAVVQPDDSSHGTVIGIGTHTSPTPRATRSGASRR